MDSWWTAPFSIEDPTSSTTPPRSPSLSMFERSPACSIFGPRWPACRQQLQRSSRRSGQLSRHAFQRRACAAVDRAGGAMVEFDGEQAHRGASSDQLGSGSLQQLESHVGRCSRRGKGHLRLVQCACIVGGLRVAGLGRLGIPCECRHLHNGRVRMRRACHRRCTRREGCMDMCSYARSHAMLCSGAEIGTCIRTTMLECALVQ